jgi:transcription initiation factor IIE alpha subunit
MKVWKVRNEIMGWKKIEKCPKCGEELVEGKIGETLSQLV